MIQNYFKIAWRNIKKNRVFSAINIIGLASGLACFILIALYVADELSYDRFNEKADRIYRINTDIIFGGNKMHLATSSDPLGAVLKKDYPQVEEYVRFYEPNNIIRIKKGNEFIRETKTVTVDSTLFDVFTLPALAGNTKTALSQPNSVVITETTAKKYFNKVNAVGETLLLGIRFNEVYKVTAVIKDLPHNSHFNFDFFFPIAGLKYDWGKYLSNNFQTYIVLKPKTDYKLFEKKLDEIVNKYVLPQASQVMNIHSMEEFRKSGNELQYSLIPLTDIHLHSDRANELGINGNIQYVYIFSFVALFILLLACVNFMNLSTARSINRSKEVGVRKVLGSDRTSLIGQFLSESILMSFIAVLVAMIIVYVLFGYFNELSGRDISISFIFKTQSLLFILGLAIVVGVLAGLYPAVFLSSFKPVTVLKSKAAANTKSSNLRSILVVFQFIVTIILVAGTLVVYKQLSYIRNKNIGYNRDQVLVVRGTMALGNNVEAFKQEVSKISGIKDATDAGFLPTINSARNSNIYSKEAVITAGNGLNMQDWVIDDRYIDVMDMKMAAGRNFSKEFPSDSNAIIINESAARLLGFDNAIGEKIFTINNAGDNTPPRQYNIVGIVKDFNFESIKENVGPLCFHYGSANWAIAFKVNTTNVEALLHQIQTTWKKLAPGQPLVYNFMDEWFNEMYSLEQRTGELGLAFTIVAIIIACLGLFGLAAFMAEQRIKEIGIRKVLGASMKNIIIMLSKDFFKLVFISVIISLPVAYFLMHKWLQNFAYRIEISWWILILAGFIAVLIALLTVSFQAIKAALANPIKSLRTE